MKEYDNWNQIKKDIASQSIVYTYKVREIYWLKVGKNIGYEADGKGELFLRPVLVFRKFSKDTFIGIPLTTRIKEDIFHFNFEYKQGKTSSANLSQIRLFDTKRINQKDGKIKVEDFNSLKLKLKDLLELKIIP